MLKNISLMLLLTLALFGCKSTIPVPQYQNIPLANYNDQQNSTEQVAKSIEVGAKSLGWTTKRRAEGEIVATLDIRKHQLVVLVKHDAHQVSIEYLSSINLKYDGKKIHRQYANWVTNLLRAIEANYQAGV